MFNKYYNGCYAFQGVKLGKRIYGMVIMSKYRNVYKLGDLTSVDSKTFKKVPKDMWDLIKQM